MTQICKPLSANELDALSVDLSDHQKDLTNNYQKLLKQPTSTLISNVSESPQCAHIAILGYN
jgi:hypothetical protein